MYNPNQKRIVARELARAGGNVRSAVRRLHDEYESFGKVSEATVRRMREDEAFQKIFDEESRRVAAVAEAAAQAAEEKRAREELGTSRQRDDQILKAAQEALLPKIPNLPDKVLVDLYARSLKEIERRRQVKRPDPSASRKAASPDQPTLDDL